MSVQAHLIQSGDQPNEDLARCEAPGCTFSVRHPSRNARLAASYRHLAEVLEAAESKNQ